MFCSSIPSYLFPFLSSSPSSCHQPTESVTLSSETVLTLENYWRVKMTEMKTDRESQSTSGLDINHIYLSAKDNWFCHFFTFFLLLLRLSITSTSAALLFCLICHIKIGATLSCGFIYLSILPFFLSSPPPPPPPPSLQE